MLTLKSIWVSLFIRNETSIRILSHGHNEHFLPNNLNFPGSCFFPGGGKDVSSLVKMWRSRNHQMSICNQNNRTFEDFIFLQMGQIPYRWDKYLTDGTKITLNYIFVVVSINNSVNYDCLWMVNVYHYNATLILHIIFSLIWDDFGFK